MHVLESYALRTDALPDSEYFSNDRGGKIIGFLRTDDERQKYLILNKVAMNITVTMPSPVASSFGFFHQLCDFQGVIARIAMTKLL
jgi:hypothetical protein